MFSFSTKNLFNVNYSHKYLSWFLALKLVRDVTYIILLQFKGWSFVLPEIYRGTEKNQKTLTGFFKKLCATHLCTPPQFHFFSEIVHSKTID